VDLNAVVREAVELLAYQLRVGGVEVALDLAPDLPALWADAHQLQQVLVNLVTNAEQAMRESQPQRRLTITTRSVPGAPRVELSVADTGPGVPPEIRSRIFEPFFTTKAPGQGTGLGLSLCHGIVEEHRGTIRVEGAGAGAVFVVDLPVEKPPETGPGARAVGTARPPSGKAILVVDDEPDVAQILADLLAGDGHRVETAPNGLIALRKLEERPWDLILSDVRMPELDGLGLHEAVRRRYPALTRRFVFITGDALSPSTRELLERTGAPSITKPFAPDEIGLLIRQVLQTE
jgi:two-component system NtrC family sensor kinase